MLLRRLAPATVLWVRHVSVGLLTRRKNLIQVMKESHTYLTKIGQQLDQTLLYGPQCCQRLLLISMSRLMYLLLYSYVIVDPHYLSLNLHFKVSARETCRVTIATHFHFFHFQTSRKHKALCRRCKCPPKIRPCVEAHCEYAAVSI